MANASKTCRVCLKNVDVFVDLHDISDEESQYTVLQCFNECTRLDITDDDRFPQTVCSSCAEDLKVSFQFLKKAIEADRILKERFKEDYIVYECYVPLKDEDNLKNDNETTFNYEECSINENVLIEEAEEDDPLSSLPIENERLKCNACYKTFKNVNRLKLHMDKAHQNSKSATCKICYKTFPHGALESHLLLHKNKFFECVYCKKSYENDNDLQTHLLNHAEYKTAKYLCSICGRGFATKQRLLEHNFVHNGIKNFLCSECPKKFATPFRLRNHMRIHTGEKPYECKECGLRFAQSNALICHKRTHTDEKPYECRICGKRFKQNTTLKTHMTLHTGKTIKCPLCDKKFSRPSNLILHRRDHTGEKPYACHICPNRYKQKSHLDRHMDTHLGIKHKCNECGKEYTKKSSLRTHMFNHTLEKPFQCIECNIAFNRRYLYRSHLKKFHNRNLKCDKSQLIKLEFSTEEHSNTIIDYENCDIIDDSSIQEMSETEIIENVSAEEDLIGKINNSTDQGLME